MKKINLPYIPNFIDQNIDLKKLRPEKSYDYLIKNRNQDLNKLLKSKKKLKKFLKESLNIFVKETNSKIAQKILNDFNNELKKFKQICPIEMLDKLDNPISLKQSVKKAS